MDEEEKIYRQKIFKIGAISIGICLLISYGYATQGMAEECGYSKILGKFFKHRRLENISAIQILFLATGY